MLKMNAKYWFYFLKSLMVFEKYYSFSLYVVLQEKIQNV